jgi:DNA-binding IscR family transcriptional regulator
MEESLAPVTCIRSGETGCERAAVCPTLLLWQELDALTNRYLDGISLRDLVTGERWKTAAEKNKD